MALTQGLRRLPALYGLKISTERANKTQGQELYDRMNNRAAEAFGTNVAFKGLALDPYLCPSLGLCLLFPSQPVYTISCRADSREVKGQLRRMIHLCLHKKINTTMETHQMYEQLRISWQGLRFDHLTFYRLNESCLWVCISESIYICVMTEKHHMQVHNIFFVCVC